MYKAGVIGDRDSILGFKALGLSVFPAADSADAERILNETADAGYAVIFITEMLAMDLSETIDRYKDRKLPAIVPIPGIQGNKGIGMGALKKAVERAVGADILFGDQ